MITYKRCTEVNEADIYKAFQIGFSDYIIKLEMTKDKFMSHFFGTEGNSLEYSVIAYDEDEPIGLILGGVKVFEGKRTLRCGAFCIAPAYRGTDVSNRIFNLHRNLAIENNCEQMLLEVIVGNDRAIGFYKKKGYKKVYDLVYYSHNNPSEIKGVLQKGIIVKRIDIDTFQSLRDQIQDIHINWQNDFDYISKFEAQVHYGVYEKEAMIGALSIHSSGRINILWVDSRIRNQGIGSGLLGHVVKELNLKKLSISFSNNIALMGFVETLGFTRDPISQYEMYITL